MATKKTIVTPESPERPVLVTTSYRGVFFGYAKDTSGPTIFLRAAQNCIYWSAETRGFLGLASHGPAKGSRVGRPCDLTVRDITSVAEVTPAAEAQWKTAPWS